MSLAIQPLEIKDFSGGITENILGGDPRRSAVLDNFFITVDKMLLERPAFVPIDKTNYILPSGNSRVNGMYSFIDESILFAQSARNLYTIDPVFKIWSGVVGPSGNEPLQGGDDTAQTTYGEYGHQIWFASDGGLNGGGILPSKIYRNSSNAWVANTAGLPRSFVPASFTNQTLLSSCITLANALRASFVAHLQDAVNVSFTTPTALNNTGASYPSNSSNLHLNVDNYSLSYFQTVSFVGLPDQPSVVPTPAPAATDETSLYTLVNALILSYEHHRLDSLAGVNGNTVTANGTTGTVTPQYHYNTSIWSYNWATSGLKYSRAPSGPHVPLQSLSQPTTLTLAANQLNDLLQKWNWHRKAVWTHSPGNDPVQFDKYIPLGSKIPPIFLSKTYPTITADFTDLFTYANNLKSLFNYHINNGNSTQYSPYTDPASPTKIFHTMIDTSIYGYKQQLTLGDVTNEDDFALMTYWLRTMYQMHFTDANNSLGIYAALAASSAGSANLTAIKYAPGASVTVTPANGMFTSPIQQSGSPVAGASRPQLVISSGGAGLATLDATVSAASAPVVGGFSGSMYHIYLPTYSAPVDAQVSTNLEQVSDQLAVSSFSSASSTQSWLILLDDFFNGFLNHVNYKSLHYIGYSQIGNPAPGLNSNTLNNPFFVPKLSATAYAFLYSHTYTVEPNGIQYEVFSNPVFSDSLILAQTFPVNYTVPVDQAQAEAQSAGTPLPYPQAIIKNSYGNLITNLPSIVNVANTNYDTANIKLEIYKTVDGGDTFYQVVSLANGTTSYLDLTSDNVQNGNLPALVDNQEIYTSGGVVGYDQPPQSKFIHMFNNTAYYGAVTDTGQFFPNRIVQSNQNSPDHAPATFNDDLGDAISGLSSTKSNLIALCDNSIYRMSNGFNQIGQGALTHDRISDVIGCLNCKSIVKTEVGVFFAGSDGFYYTDGYQLIKISLELNKTYQGLTASDNQRQSIYGSYDKDTRRIWWAMKSSPTLANNDVAYVYYLDFGIKPSGSFTTISNLLYFQPCSLAFQQGVLYWGHSKGYVMKTDEATKSDAKIDTTLAASLWNNVYIPYNYTSCGLDVGTTFKRKYITKIHAVGENAGNALIQPMTIRDLNADGKGIYALPPINYTDNIVWSTPNIIWGNVTCVWDNEGKFDLWRRMPGKAMRSDIVQFQLIPATGAIYASSVGYPTGANAVIDAVLKTATIQTPAGFTTIIWPLDVVDYVIAFQTDGYINEFKILSLTVANTVITYSDAGNLSVTNAIGLPWVIRGIKKNQRVKLSSIDIHYAYMGDQTQYYPGRTSNLGPGNGGENPT